MRWYSIHEPTNRGSDTLRQLLAPALLADSSFSLQHTIIRRHLARYNLCFNEAMTSEESTA